MLARTEVAAARAGGAIYVMGGFEPPDGRTSYAVERFDLAGRRWRRVARLPIALNHAAAASWRGSVYVLGGYSDPSGLSLEVATLFRYEPRRNRWSREST